MTEPIPTPDPLAVTICPECGYSLAGSPDRGRCPECGKEYDPDREIILYGYTASRRRGSVHLRRPSKGWRLWLEWAIFASVLLWLSYTWFVMGTHYIMGMWIFIPTLVGMFVGRFMRRTDAPAPIQVRFSTAGFAQRIGFGQVSRRPWTQRDRVELWQQRNGNWRIRIRRRLPVISFLSSQPIDISLDATPETIAAVKQRLYELQRHHALTP